MADLHTAPTAASCVSVGPSSEGRHVWFEGDDDKGMSFDKALHGVQTMQGVLNKRARARLRSRRRQPPQSPLLMLSFVLLPSGVSQAAE